MRVSSGTYRGRKFDAPKGFRTRPMGDRPKTALFNTLGNIRGCTVLDAYGGSGALAFEAISRGARRAQIVEMDSEAMKKILKNIEALEMDKMVKATQANITSWSDRNRDSYYDVILCDPPYDKMSENALNKIVRHLEKDGILVLSHLSSLKAPEINGLEQIDSRKYGNATLAYYRSK